MFFCSENDLKPKTFCYDIRTEIEDFSANKLRSALKEVIRYKKFLQGIGLMCKNI